MNALAYIENIAIIAAMVLLVWLTDSAWWVLLLVFLNYSKSK